MERKIARLVLILTISVLFFSCKKENEENTYWDLDTTYYPINVGDSAVYQYHVTRWIGFTEETTDSTYWYKEVIASYFLNENKDTIYRLECFTKTTLNGKWILKKVNQLKRQANRIFKTEDNITHEIVNYPIIADKTWDANIMIDSAQYYETHYKDEILQDIDVIYNGVKQVKSKITNYDQPYQVNQKTYQHTYTVILHDWTSVIDNDNELEVYAKGIGLVYKKQYHLVKKYNSTEGVYKPWNGYLKEWKRIN